VEDPDLHLEKVLIQGINAPFLCVQAGP